MVDAYTSTVDGSWFLTKRAPGEIREAVLRALRAHGGEASTRDVRSALEDEMGEIPSSSIRSALQNERLFVRVSRGRFRIRE